MHKAVYKNIFVANELEFVSDGNLLSIEIIPLKFIESSIKEKNGFNSFPLVISLIFIKRITELTFNLFGHEEGASLHVLSPLLDDKEVQLDSLHKISKKSLD